MEEFVGAQACIEPVDTAMNVANVAQNVKSSSKTRQLQPNTGNQQHLKLETG